MKKVQIDRIPFRNGASGPKYIFNGPGCDIGFFRFTQGETLGSHFHNVLNEIFIFTSGTAVFVVDGERQNVGPKDAIFVAAGEKHDIIGVCPEGVEGLFVKDKSDPSDKVNVKNA